MSDAEAKAVLYTALSVMACVWAVTWYVETFIDDDIGRFARGVLLVPPVVVALIAATALLYRNILASLGGAP